LRLPQHQYPEDVCKDDPCHKSVPLPLTSPLLTNQLKDPQETLRKRPDIKTRAADNNRNLVLPVQVIDDLRGLFLEPPGAERLSGDKMLIKW